MFHDMLPTRTYCKQVKKIFRVYIRAIIESESNVAILFAVVDGLTIWNRPIMWPWDISCFWTLRSNVGITRGTVVYLAGGR